jgi:hypothetical protein
MQVELSEQQLKGMKELAAAHLQEAQDAEDDIKASTDEYVKMSVELAVAGVAVTLWGGERGGGHAQGKEVARVGSGGGGAWLRLMRASVTNVTSAIAQRRSGFVGARFYLLYSCKSANTDAQILRLRSTHVDRNSSYSGHGRHGYDSLSRRSYVLADAAASCGKWFAN